MPISSLTALDTLQSGDNLPVGSTSNGDDRRASLSVLSTFLQSDLDFTDSNAFEEYTTQYDSPGYSGFTTYITDSGTNIHLILTPLAGYAAGTLILPALANVNDKQEILVNTTQAITALTIDGNGATLVGEPTQLIADDFFRLRFNTLNSTWYTIGAKGGDASSLNGYVQNAGAVADTIALRDSNADLFARSFQSTVATGTAPLVVASTTKVTNLNADLLDDYNTATASTASTVAVRDGSGNLTANVLVSDVAIGTAPLTVTSTTMVSNLNSQYLQNFEPDDLDTVDTIALRDGSGDLQCNAYESTVATGTAPLTVASTTKVTNLNADLLDDLNSATASTASTIAARDGSGDLTANVLISDVAGGTAPLTVTSTTMVSNLNVQYLQNFEPDDLDTVDTIALRDGVGDLQCNAYESTVATGTAPLTVASTTKVTNLNADLLDDMTTATASTATTIAARDGSGDLTANVLISDVAGGTAPLTVTSTTVVPNLNVDQTDGYDADETDTGSTLAARDASGDIQANAFESTVATGTAPITVASTTKVSNLNSDLLDDMTTATASTATTVAARDGSGNLTANVLVSDVAGGTAPLTITSTTVVPNLNVDQTDGYDADETDTGSTLAARDASGDIQANAFESTVATGTAPLTVASTTAVTNLNADQTDGYDADETDTGSTLAARDASGNIQANAFESTVATGTPPFTIASNTKVTSLNADLLDNYNTSLTASTPYTVAVRTSWGSLNGALFVTDQAAPAAKTTSTTLTASEIRGQLITVNNGAVGTTTLTLPTAANMDTSFSGFTNTDQSIDFSVINISTVAAEDADIATNTGWTLVGNMDIESDDAARARSSARFRARRTGAAAWTLYRIA